MFVQVRSARGFIKMFLLSDLIFHSKQNITETSEISFNRSFGGCVRCEFIKGKFALQLFNQILLARLISTEAFKYHKTDLSHNNKLLSKFKIKSLIIPISR